MIPEPKQCPHCGSKHFSYDSQNVHADLSGETIDIDISFICDSCDEEFTLYTQFKIGALISSKISEPNS